jgi:hypothetical protein
VKPDRMFHVLVLGGIALVGGEGCGSTGLTFPSKDAAADATSADGPSDAKTDEYFPSELPAYVDAGSVTGSEAGDAFPFVGPPPSDAGADRDAGFPVEAQ